MNKQKQKPKYFFCYTSLHVHHLEARKENSSSDTPRGAVPAINKKMFTLPGFAKRKETIIISSHLRCQCYPH